MWTQINHEKDDVRIVSTQNMLARQIEHGSWLRSATKSPRRSAKPWPAHFTHFIPGLNPMPRVTYK